MIVHMDNTVAKSVINKGWSNDDFIHCMLRKMFCQCARQNCRIYAISVAGCVNIFADTSF